MLSNLNMRGSVFPVEKCGSAAAFYAQKMLQFTCMCSFQFQRTETNSLCWCRYGFLLGHLTTIAMFGKARCKVCGDEVRLTLKHFSDKHRDIYEAEVAGKMKMADFMRKYFD